MDFEFEFEQAERFGGRSRRSGMLVETKNGLEGRTYSEECLVNGKVRVYTEKGKLLCNPDTLIHKDYFMDLVMIAMGHVACSCISYGTITWLLLQRK